ncbi:MAG: hypothetical protein LBD45_05030, partial [Bacteroidales bacterium]|nr:hypothetical protein [Bacteroidales bacterium]
MRIYDKSGKAIRANIDARVLQGTDFYAAVDEYLAELAQKTDYNKQEKSLWQQVKNFFRKIFGLKLTDSQLRDLLRRSYNNLTQGNTKETAQQDESGEVRFRKGKDLENSQKSGNFAENLIDKNGNINYDKLKEYTDGIRSGRYGFRGFPDSVERGRAAGGQKTIGASILGRASESSNRIVSQYKQEQALRDYFAHEHSENNPAVFDLEAYYNENVNNLIDVDSKEATVFKADNNTKVVKFIPYQISSDTPLEFLNNRIAIHNSLFPNEPYALKGISEYNGVFMFVVEQPYKQGKPATDRAAFARFMRSNGWTESKDKLNSWTKGNIEIDDLHEGNVLIDPAGNYRFIDTEPKWKGAVDLRLETGSSVEDEGVPLFRSGSRDTQANQRNYDFDVSGITAENAAEMQRIKDEAQKNGTYMKAPNGKPTNLNERQWLQVRTEKFKKWFGDWESAAMYDYLLSENWVSELTGDEFQKDGVPLTDKVTQFYLDKYNGEIERKGLGTVELSKEGVKDSMSHGIGSVK